MQPQPPKKYYLIIQPLDILGLYPYLGLPYCPKDDSSKRRFVQKILDELFWTNFGRIGFGRILPYSFKTSQVANPTNWTGLELYLKFETMLNMW